MNSFSEAECLELLRDRSSAIQGLKIISEGGHPKDGMYFSFPEKGGSYFAVAEAIFMLCANCNWLLYIKSTGVWPNSENWHLFYSLRRLHGEPRNLGEARGHELEPSENELNSSLLQICMLNGWDFYLISLNSQLALFFSHDDWFTITVAKHDRAAAQQAEKVSDRFAELRIDGPPAWVPDEDA